MPPTTLERPVASAGRDRPCYQIHKHNRSRPNPRRFSTIRGGVSTRNHSLVPEWCHHFHREIPISRLLRSRSLPPTDTDL